MSNLKRLISRLRALAKDRKRRKRGLSTPEFQKKALAAIWAGIGAPVESQIEWVAESAAAAVAWLKEHKRTPNEYPVRMRSGAVRALEGCRTLDVPPPEDLIVLVALLLGLPDTKPYDGGARKRTAAAKHVALHPTGSMRAHARAAGVCHSTIRYWLKDVRFLALVEKYRS